MADVPEGRVEVLFVDDEPFFAARYVQALEQEFAVHFLKRADEVIPFLEESPQVRGVVLDIMMPPPKGVVDDELDGGLNTGIWLLKSMRELGTWPFPVLILTNRKPQAVVDALRDLKLHDLPFVKVYQKVHVSAPQLPMLLRELLSGFHQMH